MFKAPFSFEGRIRRTEYGISMIIYAVVYILLWSFLVASAGDGGLIAIVIFIIPMFWFVIAQSTKRCHDLGNSGWWQLIPFYGLWLLFADSDTGPNEYGDNPKGIGNDVLEFDSIPVEQG